MYRSAVRRRQSSVRATPRGDCVPGGRIRRPVRGFVGFRDTTSTEIPSFPKKIGSLPRKKYFPAIDSVKYSQITVIIPEL